MKKLIVCIIIIFCNILLAQESGVGKLPSILWQKEKLNQNIKNVIRSSLRTVLKKNDYYIDVKIDTRNISKPDFSKKDNDSDNSQNGKAGKNAGVLSKFETIDEQKDDINDPQKDESQNKNTVRFEDKDPTETDGDYIVFSKLGIVAPLIDDFNDFQPDGKIVLSMDTGSSEVKKQLNNLKNKLQDKEKQINKIKQDLNRKDFLLKKGNSKTSIVEQMWKYNESIDIYKNIKQVKININISDEIGADLRSTIESIINSLSFNLGKVKPKVKIKYLNFKNTSAKKNLNYYINLFSKFSGIIATIIGVLLLGVVLSSVIKKLENLLGGNSSSASTLNGDLTSKDEREGSDANQAGVSAGAYGEESSSIGIERFESFLEKSSNGAISLIKKWIKSNSPQEIAALRAIVQQLDNNKLMQIFQIIGIDEREVWKDYLDTTLNEKELATTNYFISRSIVEEIIAPSAITDEEINNMILQISSKKAADFVVKNPSLGAILLNIMNKNFVGEVLNYISSDSITQVIEEGMKFRRNTINEKLEDLKIGLADFVDNTERVPFIKRVEELIPHVSPDKEMALFINLIKFSNIEVFMSTARKFFPNELLITLPPYFLKEKLRDYQLNRKVEYLLTLEDEQRDYLVNIFAPSGTKAADLLEFEFEKAKSNINIHKKIKNDAQKIQREYLDYMRSEIKSSENIESHIDSILEKWGEKIIAGENCSAIINSLYDDKTISDYKIDEAS